MSVFKRIKRIFKAKANRALDSLENPKEQLDQSIRDLSEEFERANLALVSAYASEQQMNQKIKRLKEESKSLKETAKKILDREEECKKILAEKYKVDLQIEEYTKMYDAICKANQQLKDNVKAIQHKVSSAKQQRDLLITKLEIAETQKNINKQLSTINPDSIISEFSAVEEKIQRYTAEADATIRVDEELGNPAQGIKNMIVDLESESAVNAAYEELKNE